MVLEGFFLREDGEEGVGVLEVDGGLGDGLLEGGQDEDPEERGGVGLAGFEGEVEGDIVDLGDADGIDPLRVVVGEEEEVDVFEEDGDSDEDDDDVPVGLGEGGDQLGGFPVGFHSLLHDEGGSIGVEHQECDDEE